MLGWCYCFFCRPATNKVAPESITPNELERRERVSVLSDATGSFRVVNFPKDEHDSDSSDDIIEPYDRQDGAVINSRKMFASAISPSPKLTKLS